MVFVIFVAAAAIPAFEAQALAQTAGPLDRFDPAPAGGAFLSVPSASVAGDRRVSAALALSYARAPSAFSGSEPDAASPVRYQLVMHTLFSVDVARRLKIDVDVPGTLAQEVTRPASELGGNGQIGEANEAGDPKGTSMNDIRVGARVEVLRQAGVFPSTAVALSVFAPSGDSQRFTGGDSVRYAASLIASGEFPRFGWSAVIGRRFQGAGATPSGEVTFGAAAALRLGPLRVGPEMFGSTAADDRSGAFSAAATSLEVLLGARADAGPFGFTLAGGPGLFRGFGAPSYRLIAGLSYAIDIEAESGGAARAKEASGSPEKSGEVGSAGKGSPTAAAVAPRASDAPPDEDGDGVPDAKDACPRVAGAPAGKRPGCPPDRDGDAIPDSEDRCPDEAGDAALDAARYGCPTDTDGDGIPDAKDACPREKGRPAPDPKANGCPAEVRVEGTQIVITQQIRFAPGGAAILDESSGTLQEIAQLLQDHPEIARVAVDGHTDNKGPEARNILLSQQRAVSVARWLIGRGVDARRLETRGFGPRRSIADNGTEEGRAVNRRVEFQILRRTSEGAAGWIDGPLE